MRLSTKLPKFNKNREIGIKNDNDRAIMLKRAIECMDWSVARTTHLSSLW